MIGKGLGCSGCKVCMREIRKLGVQRVLLVTVGKVVSFTFKYLVIVICLLQCLQGLQDKYVNNW